MGKEKGFACPQAFSDGESCLRALEKGGELLPEVLLLDVGLPGMSGLELLKEIRLRGHDFKVLMLTMFKDAEKVYEAISLGASGYLLKQADFSELVEGVRSVCAGGAPLDDEVAKLVLKRLGRRRWLRGPVLSKREISVLKLLAEGLVQKEVSEQLHISPHTVDSHLRNIYGKLQVKTQAGAVGKAFEAGLFDEN